jgi:hypothetical protein
MTRDYMAIELAREAGRQPDYEKVEKGLVGWCPECGPVTRVDEDGCCDCGCPAVGRGADLAIRLAARGLK